MIIKIIVVIVIIKIIIIIIKIIIVIIIKIIIIIINQVCDNYFPSSLVMNRKERREWE